MMRIVSAPDAVSHALDLGAAHVVMSGAMSAAVVMGENVPMPEHGAVYQVWMVHADGTAAAGPTFRPDSGAVMAIAEGDLSAVREITVTEEPMGGSTSPTGPVVARVAR
jgi:anti-sigma-K factor RskA